MKSVVITAVVALLATVAFAAEKPTHSFATAGSLVVENAREHKVITLSAAEMAKLKHATLTVGSNRVEFSGVPLAEVLRAAGVPWGGNCSPLLTWYVDVEAADGYRVAFSIPEIAPELSHRMVLLADRCKGEPLTAKEGPYMTIEEDAKQHGRWVHQVTKISLRPLPAKTATANAVSGNLTPAGPHNRKPGAGSIHLVGMGPGDAELVTIKAARVLKEADRVYCFDYLKDEVARYVSPERLKVVPFMLLGKLVGQSEKEAPANLREQVRRSETEMSQFVPEVRRLVAAGKMLAFADAGDPTIYCPWSWVLEKFADLSPTVVPGLSSFNAANAALRRSITRHSGSILLTTGDDLGTPDAKGRLNTTLVIFTMRAKVQDVVPRLAARYPADTPIAVVCEASYTSEKVVVATLGTILAKLGDTKLPHLYLIYAGDGLAVAGAPATRTENKATPGNQAACCNVGEKEQSPACSCTARSGATSSVSAGNSAASPGRIQVLTSGSLASAIGVMKQMFDRQEKVEVEVQPGRADELISLAAKTGAGDVLALVSDALMDRAELSGAIRPETRTLVGSSHTVLLVKKANPKGIRGLSDLGRPGVRVVVSTDTCLAGAWEDVVFKAGLDTAEAVSKNVVLRVPGCHFLMQALLEGKADVGLGWPFLAVLHPDKVQWVSLPPELEIRRGVCMAVTKGAKNPELAARFITYAKSRFGQAALAWWEGRAPSPSQAPQKKSEATTR